MTAVVKDPQAGLTLTTVQMVICIMYVRKIIATAELQNELMDLAL